MIAFETEKIARLCLKIVCDQEFLDTVFGVSIDEFLLNLCYYDMVATKNELCDSINGLQSHYLISDGFKLHAGNREIVMSLAKEIDYKFNLILRDCVDFGEGDRLPGVSLKKTDLIQFKIEFDCRIRNWLVPFQFKGKIPLYQKYFASANSSCSE